MYSIKEQELINKLIKFLQTNNFNLGERLPSERNLAQILNTSRNSLRSTIKMLQSRGVLEAKPGSGYYLKMKTNLDEFLVDKDEDFERKLISEQLEALYYLEPTACKLAKERIDKNNIKILEENVILISKAILLTDIDKLTISCLEFHRTIAIATNNRFIIQMMERLETVYAYLTKTMLNISLLECNVIFASHVKLLKSIKDPKSLSTRKLSEDLIIQMASFLSECDNIKLPKVISERIIK
jgi:GntR family transcriptional repressor for pyruvate dehydrogenase complex